MPKIWFVTGSSRGLRRALVEYALSKGDSVVATARQTDSIKDILENYGHSKVLLFEVNFYGVVNVTKAVLPLLRQQGSGHIFQVSSLGARLRTPGLSAYQSAKRAVSGFSSVLASEMTPLGVKVTALEPGGIQTDWAGSSMTIPPISEPYQATVGAITKMLREAGGKEPSLYESPSPPVRLLLGPDAVQYAAYANNVQVESDANWKELSLSTV